MKSFVISSVLIFISCLSFAQTRQYLLAGQSNARGRGDATLAPTVAPMTSLEYHPNLNILFQLEDPVGINSGGFQQAATGSAWPAFAKTYYDMTGDTTVMIPAARGGSGVHPISASSGANWSANGLLYSLCQFKVDQAMILSGLPLDGIVWVQGEQDAARINFGAYGQDDYRDALIALIDRFRDDYGCAVPFYMVLLGANTEDAVEGYDAVRDAQVEVAAIHPHTYLIHENAVNFPGMGWMLDNVHYTQDGYNEIGTVGAQNVVDIERTYYSITQSTSNTDTICPGDSVLLSAPPMYTNYQWSNGDTGQNIFVTAGGEYDVTVTDDTGCSFALHSVKIHAYPDQIRPMISLSANDTLCVGDMLTLTASPAGQNYVWSTGETTSSITVNTTDDFFVQTIDTNSCLSEPSDTVSTAVVSFTQPNITIINGNSTICEGESVILSAPSGFDNYVWSNGETTQSITVTTSGSFNCTVGLADCLSEPSLTVTILVEPLPPAPTIFPSSTITFCEGGSATLTASNELNNYLWSTGETTQSITVSNSGIYSCAFIGDNNCMGPETAITVIEVPLPSTPAVTVTGNTELCQGDEITLTAPAGFVNYQWSTGATTPSITVNSAGTFDVTVIDDNGCESPPSAPVTTTINPLPPAPTITTDGSTTFCEGDSVTLSAPIGFMNYQWSTGEATQSITVYDANTYFCVVTDANGCVSPISEATVVSEITAPPTPVISVNGSLTFCEGDSVTLTAPFGFSTYQWSNGANTQSITVHDSGIFDVIISNLNNCESPPSESLVVTSISTTTAPAITVNGSTMLCEGESVILTAPPGVSYLWSNSSITQSISVSTSGTYTCVITSADGCESPPSEPITVEVNPLPLTPTIMPDNSTTFCEGENVTLSAPAGFSNYLWSNGETIQTITVTDAGTFDVIVTDANGCISAPSTSISTTVNPIPTASITALSPTTFCEGDSVVLLAPSGFTDYLWSNGETTQSITVTDEGTLDVIVTDAIGCESMPSASITTSTISANIAPVITANGDTNICAGENVTLSAPAGFSNYLWSNGETTQSITVNTSGDYSCIITSTNDCNSPPSDPINVVINPLPNPPTITSNNSTEFCEGESIILSAPAGFSDYLWSTGETTQSIIVTDSGTFDVMVIDATGCESPLSEAITTNVITIPTPSITAQSPTTFCEGESVVLSAPAGFDNYLWSNGETTQSITVTDSGTFDVMVIDANDCESMPSAEIMTTAISAVTAPVITANGNTNICTGESVTLSAPPGSSGYLWSTGETTPNIIVSTPGMYTCTIIAANDCESPPSEAIEITVSPLPPMPIITSSSSNTFCEGESVTLTATAGFDNYLWSTGESTQSITVSTSGTFDVMVIDANGCESPLSEAITISTTIVQTPSITAQSPTTFCEGESVVLSAPSGFFNYLWSNGEMTQSITVTDSDTFDVIVTDVNGCESMPSAEITTTAISATTAPIITTSGDTNICDGESVTLSAPPGFSSYLWSNGEITPEITVNITASFTCIITSANGCESPPSEPVNVVVNPPPSTPVVTIDGSTTFCEGESLTLSVSPGLPDYLWSTGDTTHSITVTESGIFDVIITDVNGCTSPPASTPVTVNPVTTPSITASGPTTFCDGESVTLNVPSGFDNYLWSTGETTESITVTDAGEYHVSVTNANGCIANPMPVIVVILSSTSAPVLTASGPTMLCEGESVTLSAPDDFASYEWSNGETTQSITVSASGTFSCEITSDNGCTSPPSESITVSVNPLPTTPTITANGATTFCEGDNVILSAPSGFSNYEWSTGETTQSITITDSGNYDAVVINADGCTSPNSQETTVTVNELPETSPIAASGATTFCNGDSVTLSAPSGFQNYHWSNGETTQSITVYNSGTFEYFITDANDCVSANSEPLQVLVNDLPTAPAITASGATTFCEGESVILSAPPGFASYEWSNGETTQNITVTESGIYDYFVTNGSNCVSNNSNSLEITVHPTPQTPTIAASDLTTFCDGDSVVLSAPNGFQNYEWSTGETTSSITVFESGDYDVFVTNNNGCASLNSQVINVMVNGLPTAPEIITSGATTFCDGDSVILSAPSGFQNYEWSNGETTQNITVYNSGTFEYFLADANGCASTNSAPLEVIVNELPPIPEIVAHGVTEFCEGESVMISAPDGFSNYLWSTGETTQDIIVSTEGSYDVTITNTTNCSSASTTSAKVIVNPLPPEPIVQAVGAPVFCEGDSVTLVVPGGFTNYEWSTGETTQSINVSETGAFFCTVTDINGCENVSAPFSTVENEALPTPQITFSGETEFCEGGSVTLFAPSGYLYLWSNGETTQDITINETSGPLSCILMDNNGCMSEASDTTFVKVFPVPPAPAIDTLGSTTLCLGNTVELIAPAGFDDYMWSNGETTQSINVGVSGNYSLMVFNEDGCPSESIESVNVTINATPQQPTISINGSTNFCEGESVTLSAPDSAPGYLWSTGETTQSITVSETGSFYCVIVDEFDCQSQASVTVSTTAFGLPDVPMISLSGDAILCPGDTVILSAEPGFEAYFWSDGSVSQQIIATSDREYSYFVLDENGCQSASSDVVAIEVRPLPPVANIHSSNDFNFCEGDSITLQADEGYLSYLWSTGDTARTITVNSADEFFYTADDGFSCEDAVSVSIATGINPPPPTSEITQIDLELCASEVADRYLWYRNDTLTAFTTRCIAPQLSGNWQVVSIVDNCLSEFSTAYEYTGRTPIDPDDPPGMNVFPNPAVNGSITIQIINIPEDIVVLDIYDVLGRLLYRHRLEVQQLPSYEFVIDIERLSDAVYVAVIDAGFSGRFVQRFVVDD